MKQLETTLAAQAKMLGAELYGVISLESVTDHFHKIPQELLTQYTKAISIGMIMPKSLVECLNNERLTCGIHLYSHYLNEVITPALERTALIITNLLEKSDIKAFALPACLDSFNVDHPYYFHHLVASYAGLGWLGKSNRLINSTHGARVHCVTVLTDAELEISESIADGCKQCTLCLDHCPGKALSGIPFHPHHNINDRCDSERCKNTLSINDNNYGQTKQVIACAICLAICPYNK